MELSEYRKVEKLTATQMGALVGVSHSTISRLERRIVSPSRDLVDAIVAVTGGRVTPNDLFGPAAQSAA